MCAIDGITGMAASEDRIQAVMRALDMGLDTPAGSTDWETHLRELAIMAMDIIHLTYQTLPSKRGE